MQSNSGRTQVSFQIEEELILESTSGFRDAPQENSRVAYAEPSDSLAGLPSTKSQPGFFGLKRLPSTTSQAEPEFDEVLPLDHPSAKGNGKTASRPTRPAPHAGRLVKSHTETPQSPGRSVLAQEVPIRPLTIIEEVTVELTLPMQSETTEETLTPRRPESPKLESENHSTEPTTTTSSPHSPSSPSTPHSPTSPHRAPPSPPSEKPSPTNDKITSSPSQVRRHSKQKSLESRPVGMGFSKQNNSPQRAMAVGVVGPSSLNSPALLPPTIPEAEPAPLLVVNDLGEAGNEPIVSITTSSDGSVTASSSSQAPTPTLSPASSGASPLSLPASPPPNHRHSIAISNIVMGSQDESDSSLIAAAVSSAVVDGRSSPNRSVSPAPAVRHTKSGFFTGLRGMINKDKNKDKLKEKNVSSSKKKAHSQTPSNIVPMSALTMEQIIHSNNVAKPDVTMKEAVPVKPFVAIAPFDPAILDTPIAPPIVHAIPAQMPDVVTSPPHSSKKIKKNKSEKSDSKSELKSSSESVSGGRSRSNSEATPPPSIEKTPSKSKRKQKGIVIHET